MVDNDGGYKRIFEEPRMVKDLLQGFVKQDWIEDLDFTAMEKQDTSHINDKLQRRFNDTVWKIKFKNRDENLYICIMLEFQSRPEKFMPVRLLSYVALFYERLIKNEKLLIGEKLPPILPIVLYNGKPRWRFDQDISSLIVPLSDDLKPFMPKMKFLLIDEGAYSDEQLTCKQMKKAQNLVSSLFRLEKSVTTEAVMNTLEEMVKWLDHPEQSSLSRGLATWFNLVYKSKKSWMDKTPDFENLVEVKNMLSETVNKQYEDKFNEGHSQGLSQGHSQGHSQGLSQGLSQGHSNGRVEGEHIKAVNMAKTMKQNGEPMDKISKYTGLSISEIETL